MNINNFDNIKINTLNNVIIPNLPYFDKEFQYKSLENYKKYYLEEYLYEIILDKNNNIITHGKFETIKNVCFGVFKFKTEIYYEDAAIINDFEYFLKIERHEIFESSRDLEYDFLENFCKTVGIPSLLYFKKYIRYNDPVANCLARIKFDPIWDIINENIDKFNFLNHLEFLLLYIKRILVEKNDSKYDIKLNDRFDDIKFIHDKHVENILEVKFIIIKIKFEDPFKIDDELKSNKPVFEYFDEQINGKYKLKIIDRKYFCVQFDHYYKNISATETFKYLKELDILDYDMSGKSNTFLTNFKNIKSGKAYPDKDNVKWKPDRKIKKEIESLVQLALKLKSNLE